jgi:prevent-host-death family protein
MSTVNVRQATTKLSELLDRVLAGEDVVITRSGRPVARLVAVDDRRPRQPGIAKGRLTESFFEPLPADELEAWDIDPAPAIDRQASPRTRWR